jgi:hypothetical protein
MDLDPRTPRNGSRIRILENDTDAYVSGSATLIYIGNSSHVHLRTVSNSTRHSNLLF